MSIVVSARVMRCVAVAIFTLACGSCWVTRDTRLFRAASDGDVERVKSLIDAGGNVNTRDVEGETPLMYAAARGQSQVVLFLLSKGANIDAVSKNGETSLGRAASVGYTSVIGVLIEHGANKDIGEPLLETLAKGHLDIVSLLIAEGANVNAEDTAGDAALSYASRQGVPVKIVSEMIAAGADVMHKNKQGEAPEDLATANGHKEIAKLLREAQSNP